MAPASRVVATILGCGSSGGVPRLGSNWGDCDPKNPKNRRRRCALLIEGFGADGGSPTRVLIDTGCDMREQLLDAKVERLDAVFYSHDHADHTHGIDDLRMVALNMGQRVEVYFSRDTARRVMSAFNYCFDGAADYPPVLNANYIAAGVPVVIAGPGGSLEILPFNQRHGDIFSSGFRIGGFAYSCDLNGVPAESEAALSGLDMWVVDALRDKPHSSHFSLTEALAHIARFAPRAAVLTNLHIDLDYTELDRVTPDHVHPAYDGMRIEIQQ